ncbi:MAG: hypothetical protein AAGK37_10985 [Pseudomonadota bacterium]
MTDDEVEDREFLAAVLVLLTDIDRIMAPNRIRTGAPFRIDPVPPGPLPPTGTRGPAEQRQRLGTPRSAEDWQAPTTTLPRRGPLNERVARTDAAPAADARKSRGPAFVPEAPGLPAERKSPDRTIAELPLSTPEVPSSPPAQEMKPVAAPPPPPPPGPVQTGRPLPLPSNQPDLSMLERQPPPGTVVSDAVPPPPISSAPPPFPDLPAVADEVVEDLEEPITIQGDNQTARQTRSRLDEPIPETLPDVENTQDEDFLWRPDRFDPSSRSARILFLGGRKSGTLTRAQARRIARRLGSTFSDRALRRLI